MHRCAARFVLLPCLALLVPAPSRGAPINYTNTKWPCHGACVSTPYAQIEPYFACDSCRCNYANYYTNVDAYGEPVSCYSCDPLPACVAADITQIYNPASQGSSCAASQQLVCAEGCYQATNRSACMPCQQATYTCSRVGYYPIRCVPPSNSLAEADYCRPCTHPPLADASLAYGAANLRPSCAASASAYDDFNNGLCVMYLTPPYDIGVCQLDCAPGYINTNAAPLSADATPACSACHLVCAAGQYCAGGRTTACAACETPLLPHAGWTRPGSCEWACDAGFFYNESAASCQACAQTEPCLLGYYFIGCGLNSSGACTLRVDCPAGAGYLDTSLWAPPTPRCLNCTAAAPGVTFAAVPCGAASDAVLAACRPPCGPGQYQLRPCTADHDGACANCTAPPGPGMQLTRACAGGADAAYAPCPAGYACDGGPNATLCPPPRHADAGVCVCPPGYTGADPDGGGPCVVLPCPGGSYPDASENRCLPCCSTNCSVAKAPTVTLPGVLGLDACACAAGMFMQRVGGTQVQCWPCGDLVCSPSVQVQAGCGALGEPWCACSPPPGASAVDNETCAFQCAGGYVAQPGASTAPAVYGSAPSLIAPGLAWEDVPLLAGHGAPTSVAAVAPDTAVAAYPNGTIGVMRRVGGAWAAAAMDANALLMQGNRVGSSALNLTVAPHTSAYTFWVSFAYAGICPPYVDAYADTATCAAMELIALYDLAGPSAVFCPQCMQAVGLCVQFYSAQPPTAALGLLNGAFDVWGRDMAAGLSSWEVMLLLGCYTLDDGSQGLFLAAEAGALVGYQLVFYPSSLADADRPIADTAPPAMMQLAATQPACPASAVSTAYARGVLYYVGCDGAAWQVPLASWPTSAAPPPSAPAPLLPPRLASLVHLPFGDARPAVGFVTPGGAAGQADVLNRFAAVNAAPARAWAADASVAFGLWVGAAGGGGGLRAAMGVAPCPVDTISLGGGACAALPCVHPQVCGNNTQRAPGSASCTCLPGFYGSPPKTPCAACPANSYCLGGGAAPAACIANSGSPPGSADASRCSCVAGYYSYRATLCVLCPAGFWCLGGASLPVACANGAQSPAGSVYPYACVCPDRTHGIACVPCGVHESCKTALRGSGSGFGVPVLAVLVQGWGSAGSPGALAACAQAVVQAPDGVVTYNLPDHAPPVTDEMIRAQQATLGWAWAVVGMNIDGDAATQLGLCLRQQGFALAGGSPAVLGTAQSVSTIHGTTQCGDLLLWGGSACVCIDGYEQAVLQGYASCVPCLNGTVRAAASGASACYPCNESGTHAPWLAMSACVCLEGYQRDAGGAGGCVQAVVGGWPLYAQVSSVPLAVGVAAGLGVLAFVAAYVMTVSV